LRSKSGRGMASNDTADRRKAFKIAAARRLRREATDLERVMWSRLRNGQMNGFRFRRQQPFGPYIADFYCASAKLVVELDGSQHFAVNNHVYDQVRTRFMEARGLCVLRFSNHDVIEDCDAVVETIWRTVRERTPPRRVCDPSTLPQGEG